MASIAAGAPLLLQDHPLAGRAWDPVGRRFLELREVEARVVRADDVLLGETHDNPVHHERQASLLRAVVAAGRRPALVMEPLDRSRQGDVDAAIARGADAHALGTAAGVSKGWDWALYAPVVAVALEHRLPIVAANLTRDELRAVAKAGGEGLPERLAIEAAWNGERAKALREVLVASHCGRDSPGIEAMALMQRARDAVMADRLLASPRTVAIVGRGHARRDLGVPLYLAQRAPARKVLSIGFVEVEAGREDPAAYEEAAPGRHDLAWFTPRAERPDPCAGFEGAPPGR